MEALLAMKFFNCVRPSAVDNAAFTNAAIDTLGLKGILFVARTGAIAAAIGSTADDAALKIEECDTVDGVYSDIEDAALAAAIPAATGDNKAYAIFVNLKKTHKRYLRFNAPTAGDGTGTPSYLDIFAIAFPDLAPESAAEMGLAELVTA